MAANPQGFFRFAARYYGKNELLQSSTPVLDRLRKTEDQEVRQLVNLLDQYGVGLEQEALLLGLG
jgi:hypothetical protein